MRRLLPLLAIVAAGAAIASAPGMAAAGGCPSDQTVMTSTSNSSAVVNGYVCAQEDHFPDMSIGAGKTHSVTSTADSSYATWYSCHQASSSAVSVGYATAFGSATYTASNTLVAPNTRHWGAGMLWTLANTTPSGFTKGCSWSSSTMWNDPPAILKISSISAGTIPATATAGSVTNIPVTVSPSSATGTVAVEDHGVAVATAQLSGGQATIPWIPAADGTSSLKVVYAGSTTTTPAESSSAKSVTVSGGTGVTIQSASGSGATIALTSATAVSGTVTLIDVNAKKPIGTATVASFTGSTTVNVLFSYAANTSYTFVAAFSNSLGQKIGQAYPFAWKSNGATPASRSSTLTVSGVPTGGATAGKSYPIQLSVSPASATGVVAIEDAGRAVASGTLANGSATVNWTPAVDGQSRLTFVYTGDAANPFVMSAPSSSCPAIPATATAAAVPAATNCVTVTGGTGVAITGVAAQNTTSAAATVTVTPASSTGSVVVLNVGTTPPSKVGSATPANGSATVSFPYTAGSTYTLVAKYCTSATVCPGQSYPLTWSSATGGTSAAAQVARRGALLRDLPEGLDLIVPVAEARQQALEAAEEEGATLVGASADPQLSLVTRRTRSGRAIQLACPLGTHLIHADAVTNGPEDNVELGSYSTTGVRVVPSRADRGSTVTSQALCRPRGAKATTSGEIVYGTALPNRIELTGKLLIGFGGPGRDVMTSVVSGSTLWGGLGRDVMLTDAAGGVADGGPGADVIIAGGSGKHLLIGGLGRDSITGSFGADLINARDGKPGDTVTCRSAKTRVMADAGDVVSGLCLQVDTANGMGTAAG
jgi:hypothetical protein